jgi:hypothetical protein
MQFMVSFFFSPVTSSGGVSVSRVAMYYILLVSNFHESGRLLRLLLLRSRSFPQVACNLCQHTMKKKTPRNELKIEECTDVQSVIRTTEDRVTIGQRPQSFIVLRGCRLQTGVASGSKTKSKTDTKPRKKQNNSTGSWQSSLLPHRLKTVVARDNKTTRNLNDNQVRNLISKSITKILTQ